MDGHGKQRNLDKKFELMLMRRARANSSSCTQVILVYLYPFRCNSLFCRKEIAKKSRKTNTFRVQGHLRSSTLTFLRSSSLVLVIISSMSEPICYHFHVRRAYSGKITFFKRGAPLSLPRSRGSPLHSGMKFCHEILQTIGYHTV